MFKIEDRVRVLKDNGHPGIDINASYIVLDLEEKAWWNTPPGVYYILQDVNNKLSMCEVMENYVVIDKMFYRKQKLKKICSKLEI